MQINPNIAPAPLHQLATGEDYSRPLVLVASAALALAALSGCGESTTYNNTNLASAPHDAPADLRTGTSVVFEEFEDAECTRKAAAGPFAGMVVHVARPQNPSHPERPQSLLHRQSLCPLARVPKFKSRLAKTVLRPTPIPKQQPLTVSILMLRLLPLKQPQGCAR